MITWVPGQESSGRSMSAMKQNEIDYKIYIKMGNLCSQDAEPKRIIESNLHPKESHLMLKKQEFRSAPGASSLSRSGLKPIPKTPNAQKPSQNSLIQVEKRQKEGNTGKPDQVQKMKKLEKQNKDVNTEILDHQVKMEKFNEIKQIPTSSTSQRKESSKKQQQQIHSTIDSQKVSEKKSTETNIVSNTVKETTVIENERVVIRETEKQELRIPKQEVVEQQVIMESQKAEIEPPVYFQEGELISVSKKRKGSESSLNQSGNSQLSKQIQQDIKRKYLDAVKQEKREAKLSDFLVLGEIAKGSMSKVYRVKKKGTEKDYAMKIVKKADVKRLQLTENPVPRKSDIGIRSCPFLVKVKHQFEDDTKLYYILEHVKGQSLAQYLRKRGGVLSLAEVRFIAASVVLALEYCHHEVKVLYLDLSLESVIITGSGYVKLVDAALTKSYSYEVVKSLTFVSEHGWLSPEVVDQSSEVSEAVDLWALGILVFHLLEGRNPFSDPGGNKRKIYENILGRRQEYVKVQDGEALALINGLLEKDAQNRLGAKSTSELKQHGFFRGADWLQLYNQRLKSPLI